MNPQTKVIPPMSKEQYEALPAIVRRFVTWQDAQQGKVIVLPNPEQLAAAVEYFTQPSPSLARKG